MKIYPMNNTMRRILNFLPRTVGQLVWRIWPQTKQPEKKSKTVEAHLRKLEKMGFVIRVGDLWISR